MAAPHGLIQIPNYPDPLVVEPASGTHKQTFIVLHGRGSNGHELATDILHTSIPGQHATTTLQTLFPNAKFIFPTASKRRAKAFNRSLVSQWFDLWNLKEGGREDLQFQGLRESAEYVHRLLSSAMREVGSSNVVLWGLSQGCAVALISLMTWEGPAPAAFVGMCGWLPLRVLMNELLMDGESPEADLFERSGDSPAPQDKGLAAAAYLGEILEISSSDRDANRFQSESIFLGHGTEDEKVPFDLGRDAAIFLTDIGCEVNWQEYQGLEHWYSGKMLQDIARFLADKAGMERQKAVHG